MASIIYAESHATALGCFRGRNQSVCTIFQRNIYADLINLLGFSDGWLKNFIRATGFEQSPYPLWREWMIADGTVVVEENDLVNEFGEYNVGEMIRLLKVSKTTRNASFTLTVRETRSRWSACVCEGYDRDNIDDFCEIIRQLVTAVMNHGILNWRTYFSTESETNNFREEAIRRISLSHPEFLEHRTTIPDTPTSTNSRTSSSIRSPRTSVSPPPAIPPVSLPQPSSSSVQRSSSSIPARASSSSVPSANGPSLSERPGIGFTDALDDLLMARAGQFQGSAIDWNYVYRAEDFPGFQRKQVQDRLQWLKRRKRKRDMAQFGR